MKVIEFALGSDTVLWVDGRHIYNWSYKVDGDTLLPEDLVVGDQKIRSVEVLGVKHESSDLENPGPPAYLVFENYLEPKSVVVVTDKGRFSGPITSVVANPDDEEPLTIQLHNGKDFEVDEITLYLKATLTPG